MLNQNRRTNDQNYAQSAMTPMVDVTFLLLIFFVVTASFQLQRAVAVPSSVNEAPSRKVIEQDDQSNSIELQIDELGCFLLLANSWQAEPLGKQALVAKLKEALAESTENTTLVVKVHQSAKLQAMVDGLDSATIAGFEAIRVVQVEDVI